MGFWDMVRISREKGKAGRADAPGLADEQKLRPASRR